MRDIKGENVDNNKYWYYKYDVNKVYNITAKEEIHDVKKIVDILGNVLYVRHQYGKRTRKQGDKVFVNVLYRGEEI